MADEVIEEPIGVMGSSLFGQWEMFLQFNFVFVHIEHLVLIRLGIDGVALFLIGRED